MYMEAPGRIVHTPVKRPRPPPLQERQKIRSRSGAAGHASPPLPDGSAQAPDRFMRRRFRRLRPLLGFGHCARGLTPQLPLDRLGLASYLVNGLLQFLLPRPWPLERLADLLQRLGLLLNGLVQRPPLLAPDFVLVHGQTLARPSLIGKPLGRYPDLTQPRLARRFRRADGTRPGKDLLWGSEVSR
jgi:hypothetical protein